MVEVYLLWESGCLGVVLYSDTDIGATALLLLLLGAIRFLIAGSNTYFLSLPPSYPPPTFNGYFPYINLRGQGAL